MEIANEIGFDELAKLAFEAYNEHAGGKTYDGKDIPPFSEVGEVVQGHWRAAVEHVVKKLNEHR